MQSMCILKIMIAYISAFECWLFHWFWLDCNNQKENIGEMVTGTVQTANNTNHQQYAQPYSNEKKNVFFFFLLDSISGVHLWNCLQIFGHVLVRKIH